MISLGTNRKNLGWKCRHSVGVLGAIDMNRFKNRWVKPRPNRTKERFFNRATSSHTTYLDDSRTECWSDLDRPMWFSAWIPCTTAKCTLPIWIFASSSNSSASRPNSSPSDRRRGAWRIDCTIQRYGLRVPVTGRLFVWNWIRKRNAKCPRRVSGTVCQCQHTVPSRCDLTVTGKCEKIVSVASLQWNEMETLTGRKRRWAAHGLNRFFHSFLCFSGNVSGRISKVNSFFVSTNQSSSCQIH